MNTPTGKNTLPAAIAATARPLRLQIISLTGELWSGEVRQISLPGGDGRFGVMARHLPMLATLREGLIHLHPVDGQPLQLYVSGGFVEVQPDKVIVMADLAIRNEDLGLDQARAQAAREAAASPMADHFAGEAWLPLHPSR